MFKSYFRGLYQRTIDTAYCRAIDEVIMALGGGGAVLDCGANGGQMFCALNQRINLPASQYFGIEWDQDAAKAARARGLQISCADLNHRIPYDDEVFSCVFGFSLLEHLLNGCRFLKECRRILRPTGTLVLLTPNISTFFTAALILLGKMPSTGPHPDSSILLTQESVYKVSSMNTVPDPERDTPMFRHLVVFSFRVLRRYLKILGFEEIRGYGFGLYPFPNVCQPILERIDPYHCHQMVFIARKAAKDISPLAPNDHLIPRLSHA